jgi:hypothetical protein
MEGCFTRNHENATENLHCVHNFLILACMTAGDFGPETAPEDPHRGFFGHRECTGILSRVQACWLDRGGLWASSGQAEHWSANRVIAVTLEFSEGVSHDKNEIIQSYHRSTSRQQSPDYE